MLRYKSGHRKMYIWMSGCFAVMVLSVSVWTGCSGSNSLIPANEGFSVPAGMETQIPETDQAALGSFFSRWSAYTVALLSVADNEKDIYAALGRFGEEWESCSWYDPGSGDTFVRLALPAGTGTLLVEARSGAIVQAYVAYSSTDTDVGAGLCQVVACSALSYALIAEQTAQDAGNMYNECASKLSQLPNGDIQGGPVRQAGYEFSLVVSPEKQMTTFAALRA